ncbi:hypothetical protein EQG41_18080 [Billgrantia azerbaijanica]|nr:hypothetical protein EQG41_18080 [Halomonas azerbaijanica]
MIYAVNKDSREYRIVKSLSEESDYAASPNWFLLDATPDGWIEWRVGECPLPANATVEVKQKDGSRVVGRSSSLAWNNTCAQGGIVAYRPILDADTKPEPPAWNGEGERPPVGTRCRKGRTEVLILAYADVGSPVGPAIVYQSIDKPSDIDWAVANVFSPIRSAEERSVDAMIAASGLDDESYNRAVCRDLYRAGCRMTGGKQ